MLVDGVTGVENASASEQVVDIDIDIATIDPNGLRAARSSSRGCDPCPTDRSNTCKPPIFTRGDVLVLTRK